MYIDCEIVGKDWNLMEIRINPEISLMTETAELLCAYVNQQNPATLTAAEPYCIPVQEISKMMDAVFGDLDLSDPRLNFYFRGHVVEGYKEKGGTLTCVGVMLIGTAIQSDGCDVQVFREEMHNSTAGKEEFYTISSVTPFGLGLGSSQSYRPLFEELSKLDLPDTLRMKLLEALSNFHFHVDRLCDLLEPYALRLLPLLQPWWEMAKPRIEQWREVLETEQGRNNLLAEINMDTTSLQCLSLNLRFFNVGYNRCKYDVDQQILDAYINLAREPILRKDDNLTENEVLTLRLLSSVDRVDMLKSMCGRVMTPKELTKELGMNPGSVFRDLNSLFQVKLIDMVVEGTHRSYTTNMEYFESFLRRLHGYVKSGR